MPEPRDPLLKVLIDLSIYSDDTVKTRVWFDSGGSDPGPEARRGGSPVRARHRVPPKQQGFFITTKGWRFGPEDPNSLMILPQVHLRKPCYDFYFL